jgi:hypothetical protein
MPGTILAHIEPVMRLDLPKKLDMVRRVASHHV